MKILKKIANIISSNILGIIIGFTIFGPVGVLATDTFLMDAKDVKYDGSTSGSAATDVQGAIDSLYQKADSCNDDTYTAYTVGQSITIGNDNYYVIEASDASKDYVTLLKETPISNTPSSYGSDSTYANSVAKTAVDSWATSTFTNDELKEVNNYKARLIEVEELTGLGCSSSNCTNSSYNWLYSTQYFTMSQYNNTTTSVWNVSNDGSVAELATSENSLLRPVINIKKDAITE